ncbi:alpha/beta hydrolase [Actinocrispum wychmicini]|uniref:S-formylglutathione hydrolase FrmB n=1 Tax=Actinocrispum wychmicini TaxID=1213861 RepID=A0A4R2INK2_9PSEU|nr:alpha/beta hydrolase family protein [Actinocrispum wychmicini]TCO46723.1 S-formylglutathione hydrolase FrmB [Actinocrispum wychmicini]
MRFRGLLLAFVVLVNLLVTLPAAAQTAGAWIVRSQQLDDRLVELTVHSDAVGHDVGVRLLLPPDWQRFPHRAWPTLYLLHGCCDGDTGYRSWTTKTDVEAFTARTDVLIVMPEGGTGGFYTNWNTGPAWETFHLTELRRLLEQRFRSGHQRVVAGLSMGGFGALSYAARHPGFFRAAASFSGVVHTTYQGTRSTNLVQSIARGAGADPRTLWGDPVADAATWTAHNPFDLAGRLRGIPVYLSAGNGQPGPFDPPGSGVDGLEQLLGEQSVATADQLRAKHVNVTTDFYGPGHHDWPYWQRALHNSFPMLLAALR